VLQEASKSLSSQRCYTPFHVRNFNFLKPPVMRDDQIELVEPAYRWVDAYMMSVQHLGNLNDETTDTTRAQLLDQLAKEPRGHTAPVGGIAPAYRFWIHQYPLQFAHAPIAGAVSLRISDSFDIIEYFGHIGYHVFPLSRGQHLAERACRLILPFARAHGMKHLWITCNPDNVPSKRTLERLGAQYIETVNVPTEHPLFERAQKKCRYLLRLDQIPT
jgi:predicted acetyltransferase